MTNKKKKVNEGIRSSYNNLINEKEIESNIRSEIQKEINKKK